MRKIFYKIFLFPFILNILFQYAEVFIQIYIATTLGRFFNYAIESKTGQILKEALWFVMAFLVIMLVKTLLASFIELQRQKKKYAFKNRIYEGFLDNSYEKVEKLTSGEAITRLGKDVDHVISGLDSATGVVAAMVISVATYLIYLSSINIPMTLAIFLLGCMPVLPKLFLSRIYKTSYKEYEKAEDAVKNCLKESIEGIETIKLFNLFKNFDKRYLKLQQEVGKQAMITEKAFLIDDSVNSGIKHICQFGVYGVLGYGVVKGFINAGSVVSMLLLAKKLFDVLGTAFEQYKEILETKVSLDRVSEIVTLESHKNNENNPQITDVLSIRLRNVAFGYDKDSKILDIESFDINKGDKILVTGENGSGKSTLIKVLLGLYKNYEGEIYINSSTLKEIGSKSYRKHISWVPQNQCFFPGDGLDNMLLLDENQVKNAEEYCSTFNLEREILEDNLCDNLSGGQRQKIALIRNLIKKSGLLILDEPTNYLDQEGISKLKDVLKKSRNTIIVISHLNELSDIFDKKFVLENGSLREAVL